MVHISSTLQTLPGVNIGVQYTSEYIPKLQIHQHCIVLGLFIGMVDGMDGGMICVSTYKYFSKS